MVSIEEFDRLRAKAQDLALITESDADRYRTFREDYEITGAETGVVLVGYSGRCDKCGLAWSFEHSQVLPVSED